MDIKEINLRFSDSDQGPGPEVPSAELAIHAAAVEVNGTFLDGREKSIVLTKLEEAYVWVKHNSRNVSVTVDG